MDLCWWVVFPDSGTTVVTLTPLLTWTLSHPYDHLQAWYALKYPTGVSLSTVDAMPNPVSSGKMAAGPTNTVQPAVLYKLIIFALLMAMVPIGTYFGSLHYLWEGSTTASAISAVVAANIVLVGYVVVAFREDAAPSASRAPPTIEDKKAQ